MKINFQINDDQKLISIKFLGVIIFRKFVKVRIDIIDQFFIFRKFRKLMKVRIDIIDQFFINRNNIK